MMRNGELVAGVDEAGRGPLAGPVVAAAVILPTGCRLPGLTDSKKLTSLQRERLFDLICEKATAFSVARCDHEEIDRINILQATLLAMQRAVSSLVVLPDLVLIDGNRCPDISFPARAVIGGDLTERAISAASIIAKVTRDREMQQWHEVFPQYNFAQHKGYPTAEHVKVLQKYGPCVIHRRSFGPVAKCSFEKTVLMDVV